jgi:hypothetical protein
MEYTELDALSNLNSLSLLSMRGWLYVCPIILPLLNGCEHFTTTPRESIHRQTQVNVLKFSSTAVPDSSMPAWLQSGGLPPSTAVGRLPALG